MRMLSKLFGRAHRRIYLDYAAATPVDRRVVAAMREYFSERFANPNSIHEEGVAVRAVIEGKREELARMLRIRASGVIFTSGGTESNNLALRGVISAARSRAKGGPLEIITTALEHPSIAETARRLREEGVVVHECRVDGEGRVDCAHFETLLNANTVLVSVAYANAEVGTVEDIKRLTRIVRKHNTEHDAKTCVHVDASQAPLWLPCAMDMLGADLLTLDAGKCYGPKGVGVLAVRHGVALEGVQLGGGQERGLRAGTENVPLIVGCVEAFRIAEEDRETRSTRVALLRDRMFEQILKSISDAVVNGSREHRLPNNVNVSVPGLDGEFAVISLDAHGVAASTTSACGSGKGGGSAVVRAMTGDDARARSTLRFSLGEETTKHDIDRAVDVLKEHVARMRASERTQ